MGSPLNTKEAIKEYIFNYINLEFPYIRTYARFYNIRLNKDDKRKCAWVLFKRCKFIFASNTQIYNTVFIIWMMMKRKNFLRNI